MPIYFSYYITKLTYLTYLFPVCEFFNSINIKPDKKLTYLFDKINPSFESLEIFNLVNFLATYIACYIIMIYYRKSLIFNSQHGMKHLAFGLSIFVNDGKIILEQWYAAFEETKKKGRVVLK